MYYQRFLEIMNNWLIDPRFSQMTKYNQHRHWLEYLAFKENNYSDFLAWLLSPHEAHGLGDYFFRRMLFSVISSVSDENDNAKRDKLKELLKNNKKIGWPTNSELEVLSYSGLKVSRELEINQGSGRIDLLLVDIYNELVVVVERKDGALVANDQLVKYKKWIDENYKNYWKLFVVSDSAERGHEAVDENWIQINDDWLVSGLHEVIDKQQLPDYVNQQLKEYLNYIDYEIERDLYYSGLMDVMREFVRDESSIIHELKNLKIWEDGELIKDIDQKKGLNKVIPEINKSVKLKDKENIYCAAELAMRHNLLIDQLISLSYLEAFSYEIEKNSQYRGSLITSACLQKNGNDKLDIGLKCFDESYPIWIEIIKFAKISNDGNSDYQIAMRVYFPDLPRKYESLREPLRKIVAELSGKKIRPSQKHVLFNKKSFNYISFKILEPYLNMLLEIESHILNHEQL